MLAPRDLAEALVDYDRRLAVDLLDAIYDRLDGPPSNPRPSPQQIRVFLANPNPSPRDLNKSTREWKIAFGEVERARAFGLALAELLASGPRAAR